ncbi:DUF3152 domain-containing protein [Streptomyces corynorhini]|uniref:DUF3152 domain-containing protein n=2 Tax=Streptomyces corynorhini TaxID=2282652 RepID=A0A370BCG1_9ACTN|nr:DUF3152 domain-containing protein [Streptomyces corynorhini]
MAGSFAVIALATVGYVAMAHGERSEASAGAGRESGGGGRPSASATGRVEADGAPSRRPAGRSAASPSASPTGSASSGTGSRAKDIPAAGPGTFTAAAGGGGRIGKGAKVLRYAVSVEDGLELSAAETAEEVDRILADPRGWTADGISSFQRVSSGATDFEVKVATPGTVDQICGEYGLDTGGEVNCSVGSQVMVNLKRWLLATPFYVQDIPQYRALIVNHEVGHFLGHGHQTCPGPGRPAPAMMQQIKGLHGCVINAWPYDADGKAITGPPVP